MRDLITFKVTNQSIRLADATPIGDMLVSGTVGEYNCKFIFNDYWNGYVKTAIFMPVITGSKEPPQTYNILLDENDECVIPYSALIDKQKLRVGVCGTAEDRVLPTVYSPHLMVRVGALPDNPAVEEDTGLYEQVLQKYAKIIELVGDIDQSTVPPGGAQGQVLTKISDEDYSMEWQGISDIYFPTWEDIQGVPDGLVADSDYVHTSNDFTDEDKDKLDNLPNDADANSIESISINGETIEPDEDKNVNLSINWDTLSDKPTGLVIDEDYVRTSNDFTDEYKDKLDDIESGAEANILEGVKVNGNLLSITDKKVDITIPVKTSDLTNDSGYIIEEEDPTVPDWAKQPNKPSYTASEVGALPNTTVIPTVPTKVSAFQNDAGYLTEHQDISGKADKTEIPKKVSELENDSQYATESFVNSSIGTNTAYYINDNGEPFESFEALEAYSGEVTNNDYAFVVGQDSVGNITYTRYKYNADNQEWAKEYVLNNSSFTDKQWQSINSEITANKVAQITTNKNDIDTAKESIETLESNVETLSTTIEQKADKSEIPDVIVEDVQVNGESIVSDGVATIPIANTQNKYGVFSVNSSYGISTNSSGRLTISSAGSTDITNRTNAYRPIVSKNLVEAVDSVICSTVEGEQLTDEKKAAARNRLGVSLYDDTEIKEELTQCLKEPESIAVGKYFRIAAIDENGHAVLEAVDAPQSGVTDVKVNGSSIVSNNVANLKFGTGFSQSAGNSSIQIGIGSGLYTQNELLYIRAATSAQIDNHLGSYNAIVPANLDYAVKAAMCDGKGATWTAEEQQAAQIRLGILSSEGVEF